jgi:hypothetical protein
MRVLINMRGTMGTSVRSVLCAFTPKSLLQNILGKYFDCGVKIME